MINIEQEIIERVDKNFKSRVLIKLMFASVIRQDNKLFDEYKKVYSKIYSDSNKIFRNAGINAKGETIIYPDQTFDELSYEGHHACFMAYIKEVLDKIDWDKYLIKQ